MRVHSIASLILRARHLAFHDCSGFVSRSAGLRVVLGLGPALVEDFKRNALPLQPLDRLFECVELSDVSVCDQRNLACLHVRKIHAHLFRRTGSETDARRGHLECIVLLSAGVNWRCKLSPRLVHYGRVVVMMVRIAVARAGGRVANGSKQIESTRSPSGRNTNGSHKERIQNAET